MPSNRMKEMAEGIAADVLAERTTRADGPDEMFWITIKTTSGGELFVAPYSITYIEPYIVYPAGSRYLRITFGSAEPITVPDTAWNRRALMLPELSGAS